MNNDIQNNSTDAELLRIRAEEQLKVKQQDEGLTEAELDIKKLLHELQVQQIELEMQNEELRESNEIAESALKKYTVLYDLAPMGYFTLAADGTILELNFTGAEMLGDRRFSLVNSNFKLYVSEQSRDVFNDFFKKVYTEKSKVSCEIALGYDNKTLNHVHMEGVVIAGEQNCLLSLVRY
ncbi:MAG: PAS domain-containing protein [Paludibacter sp.]|nr:PAS domain-containing protein [Paludibacter sp.]